MESSWLSKSYKSSKNFELAMKLKIPSIKQDNFYTDLNGFQVFLILKNNFNNKKDDKTSKTK